VYIITEERFKTFAPKCANVKEYVSAINTLLPKYEINASAARLAAFLGQFGHETMGWTRLVENTNYTSPERLMKVFPSKFPSLTLAKMYAGKPVNIANRVYANRYGNGDEASGDGYKYRGRGGCHLTFKDNYKAFAKATGVDVIQHPEFLEEPWYAVLAAAWYWDSRKINALVDKQQWLEVTKAINGPAALGHTEREALRKQISALLAQ
jgi:putative chitinase